MSHLVVFRRHFLIFQPASLALVTGTLEVAVAPLTLVVRLLLGFPRRDIARAIAHVSLTDLRL